MFRGLTQSDGQASVQGELHYAAPSWYAGVTAEEVRRGATEKVRGELIAAAGYQYQFNDDWGAGVTVRHYDYPGNPRRTRYDYDEGGVTLAWRQRVFATAIASPDTYFADYRGNYGSGAAYCYELAARQPLRFGLALSAGLGYYDLRRQVGAGYAYWSAALSRQWGAWDVDLRYIGTDAAARFHFEDDAGDRAVLSVSWAF